MNEEQTSAFVAESDQKKEPSFGKFSTLDELVKAYNALESEFTRRSQKLKEYEKANADGGTPEEKKAEWMRKYGFSEEILDMAAEAAKTQNKKMEECLLETLSKMPRTVEEMASDEQVIDKVLSNEKNRETVVSAYLRKIKGVNVPPTLPNGGAIPTLTPFRPKSVREAGEIAKEIFEKL